MKFVAWMLATCLVSLVYGQETLKGRSDNPDMDLLKKAATLFSEGKYSSTVGELTSVETRLKEASGSKETLGLISYWKGVSYARNQDYPEAIGSFQSAIDLGYVPEDLHYEYGQVLFAAEKLVEARLKFRESLKKNFKRAVSLYYIGFISKELGERKKAFTFFKAIEKLPEEESGEVRQAAEMQIGDIYLEQVERHPDAFRAVENYVIPQYQRAYELNPESNLARKIQENIVSLQRKYDLVLFQLRNGRPTLTPPYFLRLAAEYGVDSNVTFSPTDTTVSKSRQASTFGKTSVMGRYTFYHDDYLSVAPELSFFYTYYFNRVPEIYRNDNYMVMPSFRTAYEHTLWNKPAAHLLDYEFMQIQRDVNAEKKLDFNSRSHAIMVGEKFNFFSPGESILRLRYRMSDSYLDTSDSKTTSLSFEQVWGLTLNTLLFYVSYDRMRMTDETYDTNAITVRGDLLMPNFRGWFTPSIGLGLTSTDPINNEDRGQELLVNPSLRLSRNFSKHLRSNLKYDYQNYKSDDEANFAYKKQIVSLELEYLF